MAQNILVINVDLRETRVSLIENGVIAELQIERAAHQGTVGNIVLGRVTRVLPGMQAAFIDVGMERAAFLHVEDLIRPDDFEAYLSDDPVEAGGKKEAGSGDADAESSNAESEAEAETAAVDNAEAAADDGDNAEAVADDAGEAEEATDAAAVKASSKKIVPAKARESTSRKTDASSEKAEATSDEAGSDNADEANSDEASSDEAEASSGEASSDDDAIDTNPDLEAANSDEASSDDDGADGDTARRSGRGRRRRKRKKRGTTAADTATPAPATEARRKKTTRGRTAKRSSRVSRSVPITEVVKEGDEVIVQISKEPIGTKGARVTSHVSLPGRYVVYLPTVEHVGISKRIGSSSERSRLRKAIEGVKPPQGGLIIRTVAEGLTKKLLKADVGYLINVWAEVSRQKEGARAPAVLYTELDLILKIARDLFTDDIQKIVIDDKNQYERLVRFVEMFLPGRSKDVELYQGTDPIFDAYGIEDEIARALSRKVPLRSGGHLILDQAEALTAVDVNTGRYVGKGSRDLEETALKTNLEAVDEIAYQLRFRNIGGLVILDLIDMDRASNRDKVWRALEQCLTKDKAKTTLNRISDLGLIEMTRKRTRESLGRVMHESCFYCDGTGQIQSRETVGYEILRQIRRERYTLPGYSVKVNAHPAIVDFLKTEAKDAVEEAESRYQRRIELTAHKEYHLEQYDLTGK